MNALVRRSEGLNPDGQIEATLALGRDEDAAMRIREAVATTDEASPGMDDQRSAWIRQLADIKERHAPNARGGANYEYIGGLELFGPVAAVSHDVDRARLVYSAAAFDMTAPDGSLNLGSGVTELDLSLLWRLETTGQLTELLGGASIQSDTPLPRAGVFHERLLASNVVLAVRAALGDPIDDTGLLRVAGVQSFALADVRAESQQVYTSFGLHVREDASRRVEHLGSENRRGRRDRISNSAFRT